MLENWININNKPNLHRVQFCYYLDRFARHASCLFSIWFYHLLGCPDRWVTTETSGKQWQHSVWFIDLRIGWHGASSRFTFPWVTQLNRGQLTLTMVKQDNRYHKRWLSTLIKSRGRARTKGFHWNRQTAIAAAKLASNRTDGRVGAVRNESWLDKNMRKRDSMTEKAAAWQLLW